MFLTVTIKYRKLRDGQVLVPIVLLTLKKKKFELNCAFRNNLFIVCKIYLKILKSSSSNVQILQLFDQKIKTIG